MSKFRQQFQPVLYLRSTDFYCLGRWPFNNMVAAWDRGRWKEVVLGTLPRTALLSLHTVVSAPFCSLWHPRPSLFSFLPLHPDLPTSFSPFWELHCHFVSVCPSLFHPFYPAPSLQSTNLVLICSCLKLFLILQTLCLALQSPPRRVFKPVF